MVKLIICNKKSISIYKYNSKYKLFIYNMWFDISVINMFCMVYVYTCRIWFIYITYIIGDAYIDVMFNIL